MRRLLLQAFSSRQSDFKVSVIFDGDDNNRDPTYLHLVTTEDLEPRARRATSESSQTMELYS